MIAAHKGEIPFALLIIPFITGIACGLNFDASHYLPWLYSFLFAVTALFISLNIGYRYFSVYKRQWLGGLLIHVLLLTAGWILVINYNELSDKRHFSKNPAEYLVVKIGNEPKLSNGILRFTAEVERNVYKGNARSSTGNLLISIKDSAAASLY